MTTQRLITLDLEGVLIPEIWIALADSTGIEELRVTTRDVPDYAALMNHRLEVFAAHGITLDQVVTIARSLDPLPGADKFLTELRRRLPVVILSDTFEQTAAPLFEKLDLPLVLCHRLEIDADDRIVGVNLRDLDSKRLAIEAFTGLGYHTAAAGDSHNDLTMLRTAHEGYLFNTTPEIAADNPNLPATEDYDELLEWLLVGSGGGS